MNLKIKLLLAVLMTTILSCGFKSQEVDLIIHNATIYSVDDQSSIHQAVAVLDGRIVALGAERAILNKYRAKETIDAAQQYIYPGFIDAHCHFYGYGLSSIELDLSGTQSWDECIARIKTYAESHTGEWITGRGWDQNDWNTKTYPDNGLLNELFPDKAIFIRRIDGHAAIANSKALQLAGINPSTSVKGGEILKNNQGELTGILIDNGMNPMFEAQPEPSSDDIKQALIRAQVDCFALGLTTIDDAGLSMKVVNIMDELQNKKQLKIRIYAMLNPENASLDQLKLGKIKSDFLNVRSVKLYGDGSLGSRGACLKEDYQDQEDHTGAMIEQAEFYNQWAQYCVQYGFQLNTHCIGDSANITLLETYARHIQDEADLRWRIEHAQVVTPEDRHFFADYGIIPSVQPTHATSDMYWAEDRLGNDRMNGAYAYQSLLNEMGIIALGTDFPVEEINPLKTFYAAVTRKDIKGFPPDGFEMDEALTRQQALMGMTIWAAMANFEETEKGSIEVGKMADFTILDHDILKVTDKQLLKTKVTHTIINGEVVYSR